MKERNGIKKVYEATDGSTIHDKKHVQEAGEFIENMHWNWQIWEDFQIETLEESKDFYKAKMKGAGEKYITEWTDPGITTNEFYDCLGQMMKQIAESLGLEYKQEVEGDWIVFTVTAKK